MSMGCGTCCVKCQTYFAVEKNGVFVTETFDDGVTPYKVWRADLLQCPDCGAQLVTGFPREPYSEHFMPDFQEALGRATITIKGCPRRLPYP